MFVLWLRRAALGCQLIGLLCCYIMMVMTFVQRAPGRYCFYVSTWAPPTPPKVVYYLHPNTCHISLEPLGKLNPAPSRRPRRSKPSTGHLNAFLYSQHGARRSSFIRVIHKHQRFVNAALMHEARALIHLHLRSFSSCLTAKCFQLLEPNHF